MALLVLVGIIFGIFVVIGLPGLLIAAKEMRLEEEKLKKECELKNLDFKEELRKKYAIELPILSFDGDYLGGFSDIQGGKKIETKLKKNKLHFNIKNDTKIISIDKITNVEIMSQQQITNGVNLGNLLVLGVFAFALPKKTKVQNYLVIQYKDDKEKERSIIIDVYGGLERTVRELRENIGLT